jgi:hypothetical protein
MLPVDLFPALQVVNSRQRIRGKVVKAFFSMIAARTSGTTLVVNEGYYAATGEMVGVKRFAITIHIARTLQQEDSGVFTFRAGYS